MQNENSAELSVQVQLPPELLNSVIERIDSLQSSAMISAATAKRMPSGTSSVRQKHSFLKFLFLPMIRIVMAIKDIHCHRPDFDINNRLLRHTPATLAQEPAAGHHS